MKMLHLIGLISVYAISILMSTVGSRAVYGGPARVVAPGSLVQFTASGLAAPQQFVQQAQPYQVASPQIATVPVSLPQVQAGYSAVPVAAANFQQQPIVPASFQQPLLQVNGPQLQTVQPQVIQNSPVSIVDQRSQQVLANAQNFPQPSPIFASQVGQTVFVSDVFRACQAVRRTRTLPIIFRSFALGECSKLRRICVIDNVACVRQAQRLVASYVNYNRL